MTTRSRWIVAPLLSVLILVFVVSCGRKTDPQVPPSPRPEAVKDAKAVARDNTAFLSWAMPFRNIEGRPLNPAEILGFRVFRVELEHDRKKGRPRQVDEIVLAKPGNAEVRDGRVFWVDRNLRYGQTYAYRIRAVSERGGLSGPSEEVRVTPLLSLAPPRNVKAVAADGRNALSWDTVTTRADGSVYTGFVGYNIYRGTARGREEAVPLNKEPVRTATYTDTPVANDTSYYYLIRSVDSPTLPWKESLDSQEVSATPRDMTPPKRPKGLTVIPGVGRLFLTWNENTDQDLAGYYVYRSTKSGRDFERITEKPINRTTFSDETVKPGVQYYYVVTAVDRSGNESPASKEQQAYAEKKR